MLSLQSIKHHINIVSLIQGRVPNVIKVQDFHQVSHIHDFHDLVVEYAEYVYVCSVDICKQFIDFV